MSDDEGFSLDSALETAQDAGKQFKTFLGVQQEVFQCPDCNEPCTETTTYNSDTAAFDGGACPAWYCSECDSDYVREEDNALLGMDLYGRGL